MQTKDQRATRAVTILFWALAAAFAGVLMLSLGCANPNVERGERLFAGCPDGVDHAATKAKGQFVCKGTPDPAPFGGNGRACGSCHVPGDNFGISVKRIATLPGNDPFFISPGDEDPGLLLGHGLIHVVDADEDGLNEFRATPKLVHLRTICNETGKPPLTKTECVALGLLGDRETDLCTFSREAVANHLAKSTRREPGVDFRVPTDAECHALSDYMRSTRVGK